MTPKRTIEQTVNIPDDRWLKIKIPNEIPAGKAQVELKVIPFCKKEGNPAKLRLTKQQLDELLQNAKTPISDSLTGILSHLGDITIEQIREERLAKYLK